MYEYPSKLNSFVKILMIFSLCSNVVRSKRYRAEAVTPNNDSPFEVRAVFLNCESGEEQDSSDNDLLRFQRQELFRHSGLRECNRKLALSVKMTTHPNLFHRRETLNNGAGTEYIPIDHAFEGANRKHVRLLNPYVVRLRRERPLQAYKLRRIDTVTGILTSSLKIPENRKKSIKESRKRREMYPKNDFPLILGSPTSFFALDHNPPQRGSYSVRIKPQSSEESYVEQFSDSRKESQSVSDNYELINRETLNEKGFLSNSSNTNLNDDDNNIDFKTASQRRRDFRHKFTDAEHNDDPLNKKRSEYYHEIPSIAKHYQHLPEKEYALYEIGTPIIWFGVSAQVFEKLDTSEGKTVWNDLTKGVDAKVTSLEPEWKTQDVNVKYRSADWLPPDEFVLPMTKLCLLEPLRETTENYSYTSFEYNPELDDDSENYVVVPLEDVVGINDNDIVKRDENSSDAENDGTVAPRGKGHRRVQVRVSRAIFGSKSRDKFGIMISGEDHYLTMPHRRTYRSVIDLEIRADSNQLVRVGLSGRLANIVTDSTRRTRSIITLQATNTGLTSAEFKVKARDCAPELMRLIAEKNKEEIAAGPVVLAPQCTRRLRLTLPVEVPVESTYCNVALVNENDEAVAMRQVTLRQADRCFCVWHCKCVCLGEDPKLMCREMSPAQQAAAGLAVEHPRQSRYVCYPDNALLNLASIFVGVVVMLLLLGLVKALLGLYFKKIATWGIHYIVQIPRPLDHYYEKELRDIYGEVTYDQEGWPVHPCTYKRSVSVVCKPMEFILNGIFFIAAPCVLVCSGIRKVISIFKNCATKAGGKIYRRNRKDTVYSSTSLQDLDVILRLKRREQLRQWMTPAAERLISDVVTEAKSQKFERSVQTKGKPREICTPISKKFVSDGDADISASETVNEEKSKSRESMCIAKRQQEMIDAIKRQQELIDALKRQQKLIDPKNKPKCECVPGKPRAVCPNAPNKEKCPTNTSTSDKSKCPQKGIVIRDYVQSISDSVPDLNNK